MKSLTIEQSKKLLELGLSKETADMVYPCLSVKDEFYEKEPMSLHSVLYAMYVNLECKEKSVVTWSLDKLIDLMPEKIMLGGSSVDQEEHELEIYKTDDNVDKYIVCYTLTFSSYDKEFSSDSLIDAVFEMMCYLLRRGLIENK